MKYICAVKLTTLVASAFVFNSCQPAAKTEDKAYDFEVRANNYLRPMLSRGDSLTNIIQCFGFPVYQGETGIHELQAHFLFPANNQEALAAGVGGFTAYFVSNQLTHWAPVYRGAVSK